MNGKILNLKSLIYKTAAASRQSESDIDGMLEDDYSQVMDVAVSLATSETKRENKTAAKIWMSSVKFVTPAVSVAIALTDTIDQADAVAGQILEQSTISGFANVVDAYSCGANFDEANIFGLYRYSLSNAANCTSYLAYMHKQVVADFGRLITAHLCEMATGIKPLSLRNITNSNIDSGISTEQSRAILKSYLNSEYPKTFIDSKTSIQVSLINALSRCVSSYMIRTKTRPERLRLQEIIDTSVIDSMERWVIDTKRATNGNILNGVDDQTRAMVAQNAINMVTAITGCATDKMVTGDTGSIYSHDVVEKVSSLSEKLLGRVIKKTNSYASVFSKNGKRVFEAVQEATLPFEQGASKSPITVSGWLTLFELPTKLCRYLVKEIAQDQAMETANIFSSFDKILLDSIQLASALKTELNIHDEWVLRALSNDAMHFVGEMANKEHETVSLDVKRINQIVSSTLDVAISGGYKNLINNSESATVMPLSALKVSIASSSVRLAALLTGVQGSAHKYDMIEKLQKTIAKGASELISALFENANIDSQVMKYGCAYNVITQAAIDQLRHELRFNMSSSNVSVVDDYLNERHLYSRINSGIKMISEIITDSVGHGAARIGQLTMGDEPVKKTEAAEQKIVQAALKL
jgi:hypothetical protein